MADRIAELEAELKKAREREDMHESVRSTMLFMLEDLEKSQNNIVRAKAEWVGTFDAITDPIFIHSKEFRITRANRAYQKAAGMPFDEIIGRPYYEVFPKMDCPFKMCLKAIEEMQEKEEVFLPSLDKIYIVSFYPVKNKDGEYLYSAHIMKDITEEKKVAEALMKSEKKYRDLVNNAAVGVYKSNLKGDILFMNQALANMFEYESPEEVISAGALALYKNPEDREKLLDGLLEKGRIDNFEAAMVTKTGEVKHMLYNATLDGDVLSGMVLDITERKNLDELLRNYTETLEADVKSRTAQLETANKSLESFSYSVSHDLRAPLRAITGFSGILMEDCSDKLDDECKRILNMVKNNVNKMGQLIDDILTFSRAGRKELELTEIDMEKLANEVIEELRPTFAGRKVQFEVKPLPPAKGDRAALHQVFTNLISNAIKFTRSREVAVIEIGFIDALHEIRDTRNELIYYIKDNGAGFDMEQASKLFGVFQRLHSADEFEGTGIGLSIVKAFITKHGGRVWAEGKVGEGATFYFTL